MKGILLKFLFFLFILSIPITGNQIPYEKIFLNNKFKKKEAKINSGFFKKDQNLYSLFKNFNLPEEIFLKIKDKISKIFNLKTFKEGNKYEISLKNNNFNYFKYWIDDWYVLKVEMKEDEITAVKEKINYDKKILILKGEIKDNLISAFEENEINVALDLSEIFSSDIDFWTDLRKGDSFIVLIEGFFLEGKFKLFGKILYSEFMNDGNIYKAYYYEDSYFDENGKSKTKDFLKTPLNFKRISSRFSYSRYHPILKIYRPHHGIDFVAQKGTPVSAIGDGIVEFAGFEGGYGNLVILRHKNGWKSYYGHLSTFGRSIKKGFKVKKGDIIGYVGSTGLATGPHLHYELRIGGRAVNPFKLKIPEGKEISAEKKDGFFDFKNYIDEYLIDSKLENKEILEDFKWALK